MTVRDKDAADTASPLFQGVYDPEKEPPLFPGWYNIQEDPLKQPWMIFINPPDGAPIDDIRKVLAALWRVCDLKLSMPK